MDDESVDRCLDSLIREGYVRVSPALDGTFELTESGEKLG
jgi:DNA-binding IclR family transcriptional regulator